MTRAAILAAALGLAISPAAAQRSADTARIALTDQIQTSLLYHDQKPETFIVSPSIYDTLVCYDRVKGEYVPSLARSWSQIDARTVEFRLREDVRFHDGTPFSADDVALTLNWAPKPESKLRFAPNENSLGWIDRVEKIDQFTVRIVAKQPTPIGMVRLAVAAPILQAKAFKALATDADYGRRPGLGTGPYRLVSYDSTKGLVLARNEDYRHGSPCKPAAGIGRVHVMPIPDEQTQIAQLTVGGIEIMRVTSRDTAEGLLANPALGQSVLPDSTLHMMSFDAAGRSSLKALTDARVRRAIAHAIDAPRIARAVLAGGDGIKAAAAACVPVEQGCDVSVQATRYDPARARALLAEAGHAAGFALEITALPASFGLADAIAGELRKIGIRASVDKTSFVSFRQKQADGRIQVALGGIPVNTVLDASSQPAYYFEDTPRNYTGDPEMTRLHKAGLAEIDPAKRKAIYRALNDRNNEMVFLHPMVSLPDVYVHARELVVDEKAVHPGGLALYDLRWR